MAFVRGTPERCPQPSPSSVEGLFAPCLVANRGDIQPPPADIAARYLPRPPIEAGGTMVAKTPAPDVDTTGAIETPKR